MKNSITVLMSVYNDAEFLNTSIKSILNQSHKEFEFLIIDDGSTDNTAEVINTFKDPRINYKRIEHAGLAAALNYGLRNSSGDWIARIDADDINIADRLKIQIDQLNTKPNSDVISSWSVYFKDPHDILFFLKTPEHDKDIKKFLNLHNPINHSSVIFDKKKILSEGGYNADFNSYEDFELWFRLKDKLTFRTVPKFLVYTRLRSDSMTGREDKKSIHQLLMKSAKINLNNSNSIIDKKYWSSILFWIEYFYGVRSDARKYLKEDLTFKKAVAFLNTYLPDSAFDKLIGSRIRYRIQSGFENKKFFRNELKNLLNPQ